MNNGHLPRLQQHCDGNFTFQDQCFRLDNTAELYPPDFFSILFNHRHRCTGFWQPLQKARPGQYDRQQKNQQIPLSEQREPAAHRDCRETV